MKKNAEILTPWLQSYPQTPAWDSPLPTETMVEVLENTAKKSPDKQAFDFLGKTYSWSELLNLVNQMAAGLQGIGVQKGHKVGLFLPNSPTFFVAYYGILASGATVVNYNPLYSDKELHHQIEDSETDILITLDLEALYPKAYKMLQGTRLEKLIVGAFTDILPFPKNLLFPVFKGKDKSTIHNDERIHKLSNILNNNGDYTRPDIDIDDDVAVLQYTGGTTGTPKGAMLTHRNITANAAQCLGYFPTDVENPKMLGMLPFFHVFAMTVNLNLPVMGGMEIITIPRFDLKQSLDIIAKRKPDYTAAVPAIFNGINNSPLTKNYDLSSLRFCISGGAPLPVEVKKRFEAETGCIVREGYGLTESSPVTHVNPPFGKDVEGSIGLPLPQTYVEIIDREDKVTPMPYGERGEVCIRGPQVMKGYWNKPDETNDVLRDCGDGTKRLHTGDIGILDEQGYTYIVDRIKDMIITNGYNVYPRNIEEAIYEHPNIEECIVAGLPHQQRGEIVKAWIKLKDDRELTEGDLRSFLEDKLSKMEMPKLIEFREDPLPKTLIGKLSRKDIVAQELNKKS